MFISGDHAMADKKRTAIWAILALVTLAVVLTVVFLHHRQPIILRGTVLRQDSDPNKQLPIGEVEITATNGIGVGTSRSDPTGFSASLWPKGCGGGSQ
jgi:hypothetical protein